MLSRLDQVAVDYNCTDKVRSLFISLEDALIDLRLTFVPNEQQLVYTESRQIELLMRKLPDGLNAQMQKRMTFVGANMSKLLFREMLITEARDYTWSKTQDFEDERSAKTHDSIHDDDEDFISSIKNKPVRNTSAMATSTRNNKTKKKGSLELARQSEAEDKKKRVEIRCNELKMFSAKAASTEDQKIKKKKSNGVLELARQSEAEEKKKRVETRCNELAMNAKVVTVSADDKKTIKKKSKGVLKLARQSACNEKNKRVEKRCDELMVAMNAKKVAASTKYKKETTNKGDGRKVKTC